jgi:L-threonylcarbamoyladenylate synthase
LKVLRARAGDFSAEEWEEIRSVLSAGGLLIYPTDTLYALGGLALHAAAAGRVRRAKSRDDAKPLPVVAADRAQVQSLSAGWPESAERLMQVFWPGPLTLVLPAAPVVPEEVTAGTGTVGVRVPASDLTRRLCATAGPLISTSANRAGGEPPLRCEDVLASVGEHAALALDAGPGSAVPSTVVDLTSRPPLLVRAGAIPWEAIGRAWTHRS